MRRQIVRFFVVASATAHDDIRRRSRQMVHPNPMIRFVVAFAGLLLTGCATRFDWKGPSTSPISPPFDAAIVLGCPSQSDGRPTLCQLGRALQASLLWKNGSVRNFITSGAAVHTPYVEAEAMAAIMVAAGVPAEHIYLDPNALHTDENVYNGLQIAKRLGWQRLAVLSDRGHSAFGCEFLSSFGSTCVALSVDRAAVRALHQQLGAAIDDVRTLPDPAYRPLADRERAIFEQTGRKRPPSFLLYPAIAIMRTNGETWVPNAPASVPILRYADRR